MAQATLLQMAGHSNPAATFLLDCDFPIPFQNTSKQQQLQPRFTHTAPIQRAPKPTSHTHSIQLYPSIHAINQNHDHDHEAVSLSSTDTNQQSTSNPGKRVRKPHNKVRTGCRTCKIRRKKCDETKPACHRCTSTGRKCDGYPLPLAALTSKMDAQVGKRNPTEVEVEEDIVSTLR